jgi:anti-sigma factor RsiW
VSGDAGAPVVCARGGLPPESLSALVDGDLPAAELGRVRAHVEACAACARGVAELAALARAARHLDAPEPSPTLWPSIEGTLEEPWGDGALDRRPGEAGRARRTWARLPGWRSFGVGALAGAAAVALAVVVGGAGASRGTAKAKPAASDVAAARPEAPRGAAPDPLLAEAEAELARAAAAYERSIEKLHGLVAREERGWSPDARTRYAERLARLDETIARSREAVRRGPADGLGSEQLFAAYQQKIAFLAEAVQRGGGWPRGPDGVEAFRP